MSRLPLFVRVLLALVIVGLIPLGVASWRLIDINREGMRTQVKLTEQTVALAIAEQLNQQIQSRSALVASCANNELVVADAASPGAQEVLRTLLQSDEAIGGIQILTNTAEEVVRLHRRDTRDSVNTAFASLPETRPVFSRDGARVWMLITRPIAGYAGFVRFAIDVRSQLRDMVSRLTDTKAVIGTPKGLYLVGTAGDLEGIPATALRQARSGAFKGTADFEVPGGAAAVAAWAPGADGAFFVITRRTAEAAHATAANMRRVATRSILLAVLVVILICVVAYVSLVRPIRELLAAQKRVVGEAAPLDSGKSEIQQLRSTFDLLEKRLRDQEELGKIFLGRYQVLSVLGQGGMGTVFAGWDPKLQRKIALKTVRFGVQTSGDQAEMVASLLREAVMIAGVNHPNIVNVYDVYDSTEAAFVAMELVNGPTLQDVLAQRRILSPGETAVIGLAIARALAAAHAAGVVHHDIKPANVLLGLDGSIKVTDFGISELISSITKKNDEIFGTPGYIPPEALRGGPFDQKGDLFSLGVVLYYCLAGRPPFSGKNLQETAMNTIRNAPAALSPPAPTLFSDISSLTLSLLEKDPAKRLGPADHVAEILSGLVVHHRLKWELKDADARVTHVHGKGAQAKWVRTRVVNVK